jgi:site-specific DNA recombinase
VASPRSRRQIDRLVDANADGMPAAAVKNRLAALEARRLELEALAKSSVAPAPRLHPNLAEVYRQRVAELAQVLTQNNAAEARELVRSLMGSITLVPDDGKLRIEVRGALGRDPASGRKRPCRQACGCCGDGCVV